jgi:uncharacterized protein YndB with AHSA1/START domain
MPVRKMAMQSNAEAEERVLTITRVFDAPASVVFKLWTKPEHLRRWWGPKGFTTLSSEIDVRLGGAWNRRLLSPEGVEVRKRGVYHEIVEAERLVFTYATDDAAGNPGHETLVRVEFAEIRGKTRVTLRQAIFASASVRDDHGRGWSGCLARFAEYLATNLNDLSINAIAARLGEECQ